MSFPIPNLPTGIPLQPAFLINDIGSYDVNTGLYIEKEASRTPFSAAFLPVLDKDLAYTEGTYGKDFRKIYCNRKLQVNDQIEIFNKVYTVDKESDYEGLGPQQFYRYIIKREEVTRR